LTGWKPPWPPASFQHKVSYSCSLSTSVFLRLSVPIPRIFSLALFTRVHSSNNLARVFITVQTAAYCGLSIECAICLLGDKNAGKRNCRYSGTQNQGDSNMLGMIAAVLIVLWLLGFFAFHITAAFIHILLVVGIVMLLFHFLRGRSATA
jgi:hypothetical protein